MKHENEEPNVKKTAHLKILRLFLTVVILIAVFIVCYAIIKFTGLWDKINSTEKLKAIVESGGMFSFVVFVILQILQTTILQIPAPYTHRRIHDIPSRASALRPIAPHKVRLPPYLQGTAQ